MNRRTIKGIGVSGGYASGNAFIIADNIVNKDFPKSLGTKAEKARLEAAIKRYEEELLKTINKVNSKPETDILNGYLSIINDPIMLKKLYAEIEGGASAESSVDKVMNGYVTLFQLEANEVFRQRATDFKDIKASLTNILLDKSSLNYLNIPKGSVLIENEISPSTVIQINKNSVAAIISNNGGATSHSAILARAAEIPAVFSADVKDIKSGDFIAVDGFSGEIIINPDKKTIDSFNKKKDIYINEKTKLKQYVNAETKIKIFGNIENADEAKYVIENGADGIGLFRTEFLFINRTEAPHEEEQYKEYSRALRLIKGKELIIRTLDIGGDKMPLYLNEYSSLGERGIRFSLQNKAMFKVQLRAVFRAAVFGNIKLMLPFITSVEEVKEAKKLICECYAELKEKGIAFKKVPLGVMIETPMAVIISDLLAKEADFFSIGTNDLTSCILSLERSNTKPDDVFHPAVLRSIEAAVEAAKSAGKKVSVCGESAADIRLISKLIEWGADALSVSPSLILQTKKEILQQKKQQ